MEFTKLLHNQHGNGDPNHGFGTGMIKNEKFWDKNEIGSTHPVANHDFGFESFSHNFSNKLEMVVHNIIFL